MIASCELFRTMREMSTRFMGNLLLHHYFIFLHFHPQFSKPHTCSTLSQHRINPIMPIAKKRKQLNRNNINVRYDRQKIPFAQVICLKIQTHKKKEKRFGSFIATIFRLPFFPVYLPIL